jgi:hypothetical protein
MRRFLASQWLLYGLGLFAAAPAHGQLRAGEVLGSPTPSAVVWEMPVSLNWDVTASPAAMTRGSLTFDRVLVGTTLGAMAGGAAGLGLAAALEGDSRDGDYFPWVNRLAGAVLGSIPGMYVGARISSDGSGNPWLTGAAAVGGTALGVVAGGFAAILMSETIGGSAPEFVGLAVGVAVPLVSTALVETRRSRR